MTPHRKQIRRTVLVLCTVASVVGVLFPVRGGAQKQAEGKSGYHTTNTRPGMAPALRVLVDEAMGVVCTQAKLDPNSSVAIDEMQARPSLPVQAPEAKEGAARAQRMLPVAKKLVINSLRQLVIEYGMQRSAVFNTRVQQGILRVQNVRSIKPDMESRDNASVFLSRPHTITFGTIFLAGLRSDEGMISVLSHELMHIADGDRDNLRPLVSAIGLKATGLTGIEIRGQKSEELTCDLIGAMAVRSFVSDTPGYESIARRLSRSIEHNCVTIDDGDDDHLSPLNTIRALLALHPTLIRELIYDREERSNRKP